MLQVGAATLFAGWALVQVFRGRVSLRVSPLFAPALLLGLIVSFQLATGLTAYRYETWVSALLYGAYGLLLFLTTQFFREKRHFQVAAWTLSGFGFLLALFAITQDLTSGGLLYWVHQPSQGGSIYGPYVNRNHYAGMMEMLFVFPLALSMGDLARGGKRLLLAFAGTLMAASIVFSQSRGGMVVLLLQVLLLSGFMMRRRQSNRATRMLLMLVPICLLAWWLGSSVILHRWSEASTADRFPIWRDVIPMILAKPIMGFGLGTFSTAFPPFRSIYSDLFVNAAHNDYLQILAETGILGGAAFLWFLVALYRHALPRLRFWNQDWVECTRLAALAGCTGIVLHSFVDFNLQIPANAAMFVVLAGIAVSGRDKFGARETGTDAYAGSLPGKTAKKGVLRSIASNGHGSGRSVRRQRSE
jgi:O-antigen ligase